MSPSSVRKKVRLSEAQSLKTNGIPKRLENFTRFFLVAFYKLKIIFQRCMPESREWKYTIIDSIYIKDSLNLGL